MNTREQLNVYLRALETRLRWMAISKGAPGGGSRAGRDARPGADHQRAGLLRRQPVWARVALFLALALALGYALVIPLTRLNRKRAATSAEAVFPQFQERLLTYVERRIRATP